MPARDTRFQTWLKGELASRDWSQAKLARELDVFKGTVGRWLMPTDYEMHRAPSYESCRRLADLFGVDLHFLLEAAGIDSFEDERNLSELQRDTIALIQLLPNNVLAVVYPQLRALLDTDVQERVRRMMQEGDSGSTDDPDKPASTDATALQEC